MSSTKEQYISNTLLKDKPRHPVKLSLKDSCVTTKKLADKSVTMKKLSDDVIRMLNVGGEPIDNRSGEPIDNRKGMIVMCSVFSEDSISENVNIGDIGTFIYQNGTLAYKKGQKESGDEVVGDYEKMYLSMDDVYLDMQTGSFYCWNGYEMEELLSPLTTEDIDRIIEGEKASLLINTPDKTEESEVSQVNKNSATKMVIEDFSSPSKIQVLNIKK